MRRFRSEEVRRALLLTGLSTIVPGLGLIFTRKRRSGLLLLCAAIVLLVVLGYLTLRGGLIQAAARLLTNNGLILLLVIVIVGGLLWLVSIILTARETSGRGWPLQTRWLHRGFAALMCLCVAVPAANAAHYVLITKDTFSKVFQSRYAGRGDAVRAPGSGSNPWANIPRLNILLLGSDAGADRTGVRTDSMMVVSVDTKTGDATLVSIPRNLQHVPFPANNPLHKVYPSGFYCPQQGAANACMMDAVWTEAGVNHRNLFPKNEANPGLDTTREVISQVTGLPIDYTTVIDLSGFEQLVDAMGGVYINIPKPPPGSQFDGIPIGGAIENGVIKPGSVTGILKPGYRKLDGYDALWYSRSRVGAANGDDDRMRRQRCMVDALISQANPVEMITKFTDVMNVAKHNISIDIPQDKLPAFATLVERMKHGNLRTVNISTAVNHVDPDFAKIRALIKQATAKPHDAKAPTPAKTSSTATPTPTATDNPISETASSC
ncbi:LCP family protein [Leekyejoonella antrihumi]|uniref:LCP family protein n=1 Tax=Leekyejoonella antrihumi TaxID=1660198 RepID=UPI001647D2FD|nr:LCP family protein [Leekyejoonella antrihumi]